MYEKHSFKTSWLGEEEKWKVQLLTNGELNEEKTFSSQREMFEYIAYTMCLLQIAGEDWTFTYTD